jgi:hypothetical protein
MPGSYEEAEAIARGQIASIGARVISDEESAGSSRSVYKIGNVVYKRNAWGDNEREYAALTAFKDEPWSSPVSLYDVGDEVILAMPFYETRGDVRGMYDRPEGIGPIERAWLNWAHSQPGGEDADLDIHIGNYRYDTDGQLKIIDAAGSSWAENE